MKNNKHFPYVSVRTVSDYFNLPKEKRTKWGVYLKPYALPISFFDETKEGWTEWSNQIRKEFPIQGWFREWFLSWDNPLYAFVRRIQMRLNDIKYAIKNTFDPGGKRYRKVWPRHKWMDIVEVLRESNFALILDFWYDEVQANTVNWEVDDQRIEFYNWLSKSVFWIEKARKQAEENYYSELSIASDKRGDLSYEERYGKTNELEKFIQDTDNRILTELMQYREYFWT